MKKEVKNKYTNYMDSLSKLQITTLLDNFHIPYKKSAMKESLVVLCKDNLDKIITNLFSMFQYDEYLCLKLVIKKNGIVKTKVNQYLINFLNNLTSVFLVIKENDRYIVPNEILNSLKKIIKRKDSLKLVLKNTEKYNLILGFIDVYGAINFDLFYEKYNQEYSISKDELLENLKDLANFYKEFKILSDKNTIYIVSKNFKNIADLKKQIDLEKSNFNYTLEEIRNIHNFKFMHKKKSYKRLKRYIESHYYVENGGFKIFERTILSPYMSVYNLNNNKLINNFNEKLNSLFEFKNEKQRDKFMDYIKLVAEDFPKWNMKKNENEVKNDKKES